MRHGSASLVLAFLVSIAVVNIGYGFSGTFHRLGSYRFHSELLNGIQRRPLGFHPGGNRFSDTFLSNIPIPLPREYLLGIDLQRMDFERGLPSYLRGQWADHRWWYYYVYALAIKEPLGTWCLLLLAVGATIFGRGYNLAWRDEVIVLVPGLVVLFFVSSQTGFSVHSRYVIPALPFFFVWMSKVARAFDMRPFTRRRLAMAAMVALALTWSAGSSLTIYPHSLSYFNELAVILPTPADEPYPKPIGGNLGCLSKAKHILGAGPRNGPRHLLDSNVDWGQDLLLLKAWLNRNPDVQLDGLAYWGVCPLAAAGVPEAPPPPRSSWDYEESNQCNRQLGPRPGWYALSVNCLYDRRRQYRYFLRSEPVALVGYSIYIYHITFVEANRIRKTLQLPELDGIDRSEETRLRQRDGKV